MPNLSKVIIGIDNGIYGAIGIINSSVIVYDMPIIKGKPKEYDLDKIYDILVPYKDCSVCFIERAFAMPKQGVVSTFRNGYNFGLMVGILSSLKIPYYIVHPLRWTKLFDLSKKEDSVIIAKKLFPGVQFETKRGRLLHGRSDALLIAYFGKKQLEENNI